MGWRTGDCRINSDMKILSLINEGLIRVPHEWIDQVMQTVAGVCFKYLMDYYQSQDNAEAVSLLKHQSKIVGRKYGSFDIPSVEMPLDGFTIGPKNLQLNWDKLDSRYRKTKRQPSLGVTVGVQNSPENAAWYDNSGKTPVLGVDLSKSQYFKALHKREYIRYVGNHIELIAGYVEHELMHYIQEFGLGRDIDSAASAYYTDDTFQNVDLDKYYATEFEFGPNVLTAFKSLSADMSAMRKNGTLKTKQEEDALVRDYLMGKSKDHPNPFFASLYKNDRQKWQKAVKYFHSLLQSRPK